MTILRKEPITTASRGAPTYARTSGLVSGNNRRRTASTVLFVGGCLEEVRHASNSIRESGRRLNLLGFRRPLPLYV
jgi:hypothetical protein